MEWVGGVPQDLEAIFNAARDPGTEDAFQEQELGDFARLLRALEDSGWSLVQQSA